MPNQATQTKESAGGFWAVYASIATLPLLWGWLVPWFAQLDPIAHRHVQSLSVLLSLGVVLAAVSATMLRLKSGTTPYLPYRTARDLAGFIILGAFAQWGFQFTSAEVPYLVSFTVLCLNIGSGLPVALVVYILGRRTIEVDVRACRTTLLPSVPSVFMLNAASVSLVTALVLGIGLTARSAGKLENEQGKELGRISLLMANAVTAATDNASRERILNLWQRTGYGAPLITGLRETPVLLKNAREKSITEYGFYVLEPGGARHHVAYRRIPGGVLWLTLRADTLPPVRAPDLGPALLLLIVLLLGAPFATWLVATDLKSELQYITDALARLARHQDPDPEQQDQLALSIALPGVPIPGNDEAGDLAAELNQACRSFANANQTLVRELRLAAQSDEAQSLFLHGTSQALRHPLVEIAAECQSLKDTELNTAQLEDIGVIESATQQLTSHVDEILKLSRLTEWEALPLELSHFDVGTLATEVLTALADRTHPGVSAEIATADNVRPVYADRKRVRQVLENLIDNALKFTTAGFVRVTVINGAFEDGRSAVNIQVWDSGPGIPEAEQDAVFSEFYRVNEQRAVPGTGLGLAIASRLVERHAGRLWVESIVGEGSSFHLLLPTGESA